jgi:hypothetical protein
MKIGGNRFPYVGNPDRHREPWERRRLQDIVGQMERTLT